VAYRRTVTSSNDPAIHLEQGNLNYIEYANDGFWDIQGGPPTPNYCQANGTETFIEKVTAYYSVDRKLSSVDGPFFHINGSELRLRVNLNSLKKQESAYIGIWIDKDRNGTFELASKFSYEPTYDRFSTIYEPPIHIIDNIEDLAVGETLMRVVVGPQTAPEEQDPCGTIIGEVRDYKLNVIGKLDENGETPPDFFKILILPSDNSVKIDFDIIGESTWNEGNFAMVVNDVLLDLGRVTCSVDPGSPQGSYGKFSWTVGACQTDSNGNKYMGVSLYIDQPETDSILTLGVFSNLDDDGWAAENFIANKFTYPNTNPDFISKSVSFNETRFEPTPTRGTSTVFNSSFNLALQAQPTVYGRSGDARQFVDIEYTVTENTFLRFTFQSTVLGDLNVIGFSVDGAADGEYQLFPLSNQAGDEPQEYLIPVGESFQGLVTNMFFGIDNENGAVNANSLYSNISLFEDDYEDLYPDHALKSGDVMFVDDLNRGRLYPGLKIGNENRWLEYQADGNLVFYTTGFNGPELDWQTHTATMDHCAGYMELSPYYGITVVDCKGDRVYQQYSSRLDHTNFHLDVFGSQLRLFNMDKKKQVWAVQGDNSCSSTANSCVGPRDIPLSDSAIESIWEAQGWSLPSLDSDDHNAFFSLMNDDAYADSHADAHRVLAGYSTLKCDTSYKDTGLPACPTKGTNEHAALLNSSWEWIQATAKLAGDADCAVQGFDCATLDEDFYEVKLFNEYIGVIERLNDGLEDGTIDATELLTAMMVSISPDKETDLQVYNGLGRIFNWLQKDDAYSGRLLSSGTCGKPACWWDGDMARAIGASSGNMRFDISPIELNVNFKDLADFIFSQIREFTGVSPTMLEFFNSIQIRVFVTWPSYDKATNRSDFDIRLRVQDLAGAKWVGPGAGPLGKYLNLDFDGGPSSLHEWQWKFRHDIVTAETKLLKRNYNSSLGFIVEGTFSPSKWVEKLITNPQGAPTDGEVELTTLEDGQLNLGSFINSAEASLAASQGSSSTSFFSAQYIQESAQAFNDMSDGAQSVADSMLSYNTALSQANPELTLGAQVQGRLSLLDAPVNQFIQETESGFEMVINTIDNLGFFQDVAIAMVDGVLDTYEISVISSPQSLISIGDLSPLEAENLSSAINSNLSVIDSLASISDSPKKPQGRAKRWFLHALAWLSGQTEGGIGCGLTTKYYFMEKDWAGNVIKKMDRSDINAIYGTQAMYGAIGGGLAGSLLSRFGHPVVAANTGQMTVSYFGGDTVARNGILADKDDLYDHGAACSLWGAYRPKKLALPDKWVPEFLPNTFGGSLGLDKRQRLQFNWEFIGNPDFIPFRRLIGTESLPLTSGKDGQDSSWKTYDLPQFKEKTVLLNQMQTYNDPDTANVRTNHLSPSSYEVKIEEETSKDKETNHGAEAFATIALTEGDILNKAGFTIGESGRLSANAATATDYKTLTFKNRYTNPIVIMEMSSYNDSEPSHIRLADKTASSVKYLIEEWDYLDQVHLTEDISYIVMEAGAHSLQAGEMAVAGEVDAETSGFTTVNIPSYANGNRFDNDSPTTVFVQPHEGELDPHALTTRIKSVNTESFQVKVEREEKQEGINGTETVGFIAFGSSYDKLYIPYKTPDFQTTIDPDVNSVKIDFDIKSTSTWNEGNFVVVVNDVLLDLGSLSCNLDTGSQQGFEGNISWTVGACQADANGNESKGVSLYIDDPSPIVTLHVSSNLDHGDWVAEEESFTSKNFYLPVGDSIRELVNFNGTSLAQVLPTTGSSTVFNSSFNLALQAQPTTVDGLNGNVRQFVGYNYNVIESTILEFTFQSTVMDFKNVIGFVVDGGGVEYPLFKPSLSAADDPLVYRIPVGQDFQGSITNLVFGIDNDNGAANANSLYSNIRLYDNDSAYCLPASSSSGNMQIEQVLAYGAGSNPTPTPIPSPFDFYQGAKHKFDVFFTNPDGLETYLSLWLDSNGDGDFDKQLINGEPSQNVSNGYRYLEFPSNGWIGETMMRVVLSDDLNATRDACSLSGNTVYQDIPVNLTAKPVLSFPVDSETVEVQWDMVITEDYTSAIRPDVAGQQIELPTNCSDSCSSTSGVSNGIYWAIEELGTFTSDSVKTRRLRVTTSASNLGSDITLDFSDNLNSAGVQEGWSHGNFVTRSFNLNQGVVNFNGSFPQGHGGPGEDDPSNGSFTVDEGGSTLSMTGNRWLHIPFDYKVTKNTILEFDFGSTVQGEIQGIGFDDDEELSESWFFQVYGTEEWGIQTYDTYGQKGGNKAPGVQSFKIPVGEFFEGDFTRLVFALDDDAGVGATATYSNVRVYETGPPAIDVEPVVLPVAQYGSYDESEGLSCSEPPSDADLNNTKNGLAPPSDCAAGVVIAGDSVDVNTTGNYQVTFDYTSTLDGEAAAQVSRTVRVMSIPIITVDSASVLVYQGQSIAYDDEFERNGIVTCGYDVVVQVDCLLDVVITSDLDVSTPGTYTITYNYTNPAGTAADTQTRTVKVQSEPVITLQNQGPVSHELGTDFDELDGVSCEFDGDDSIDCSEDVNWVIVDSAGIPIGSSTNGDGINGSTPTGEYTISYVYTNAANLTSETVTRTVTVMGKPHIALTPGTESVPVAAGAEFDELTGVSCGYEVDVMVNCSSDVSYDIVDANGYIIYDKDIDASTQPGEYVITYNYSNPAGIAADIVTRTVTVMSKPIITVEPASVLVYQGKSIAYDDEFERDGIVTCGYDVDEQVDCLLDVVITSDLDVSTPGTYTITYNYTSSAGTAADTKTRTVKVQSRPVITLVGSSSVSHVLGTEFDELAGVICQFDGDDSIECSEDVNWVIVDSAGIPIGTSTSGDGINGSTPTGEYTISYVYTNAANLTSDIVTRTVTVMGKPTISISTETVNLSKGTDFDEFDGVFCTYEAEGTKTCIVDYEIFVSFTGYPVADINSGSPVTNYHINYNATNPLGVSADTKTREVTIWGKPVISLTPLELDHPAYEDFDESKGISCLEDLSTSESCLAKVTYPDLIKDTSGPGSYGINYSYTNPVGILALATRSVTVIDTPIITVDSAAVTVEAGTEFDELSDVTCTMQSETPENCLYQVAYQVVDSDGNVIADGITTDTEPGEYVITYSFTNTVGLSAQEVTRTVIVEDSIKTVMTFDSGSDGKVTLPLIDGGVYDFTVDWGDGSSDTITVWDQTEHTHTYSAVNTLHTITIRGQLEGFSFHNSPSRLKIREISEWGELAFSSENVSPGSYFRGAYSGLTITAEDAPDLSTTTNMSYAFSSSVSGNISNWNTSAVTNMSRAFQGTNGALDPSNWDTSSVTDMSYMFYLARNFNVDISAWNTSSVTNMKGMFKHAETFSQDIGVWETSSVTDMSNMFDLAYDFNGDISGWNTGSVTTMVDMFNYAYSFNQNIGAWDTSAVTNMFSMFNNAWSFNGDIRNWDTGSVTNMRLMFAFTYEFNQPIGTWDTSSVVNMSNMFNDSCAFNQPIGTWDTSSVTNMDGMLWMGCRQFDQNLSAWDISNVTTMRNFLAWNSISTANYNPLLYSWGNQAVQPNVRFSAAQSKYTPGGVVEAARTNLVDNGWIINDGGPELVEPVIATLIETENHAQGLQYIELNGIGCIDYNASETIDCANDVAYTVVDSNGDVLAGNDINASTTPGSYIVSYNYSNLGIAAAPVTRTVTVMGQPTISVTGGNVNHAAGTAYTGERIGVSCSFAADVPRDCANDVSYEIVDSAGNVIGGSVSGDGIDAGTVPGEYSISYGFTNPVGLSASPVIRAVTVMGAPTITLDPSAVSVSHRAGYYEFAGVDCVYQADTLRSCSHAVNFDLDIDTETPPGTYDITYSYSNPAGVSASPTRAVTVADAVVSATNLALGQATSQSSVLIERSPTAPLANVALDKTARQSSTASGPYDRYRASTAINGVLSDFSLTYPEAKPWWEVDLEGDYDLTRVMITNRGDCCQSRLKNFDVFYYDASRAQIASNYYPYAVGANVTIPLAGDNVRYVRVQLRGTDYLHMAEVEVMGVYAGTASSISYRGVDGTSSDGSFGTTAITKKTEEDNGGQRPWWQLDFAEPSEVHEIRIENRANYHTTRLRDFNVIYLNDAGVEIDRFIFDGVVGPQITLIKYVQNASSVRIQLRRYDYLQLGEVEVTGIPMSALPTQLANVALDKTARQSSTASGPYDRYRASTAINGVLSDFSLTYPEAKPWWEVDLEGDYDLTRVKITNRGNCCQSRLKNFDVFYYDASRTQIARYYYPYAVGANVTLPLAGDNVRYVRVQLRGTEVLHMAEVEVQGLP
jgi:surface protein